MNKIINGCIIFLFSTTWLYGQQGEVIYKKYCAGCHGSQLEGNSAGKLIKQEWIDGKGRDTIHRTIKNGVRNTEMVGWSSVLKEEQIRAVVDFILEAQEKKSDSKTPIPQRITTKDYVLKIEKIVVEGLDTPWGIEFIDQHKALITEKGGNIKWLINGKLDPQSIQGVPLAHTQSSTGGYMDIALDPKFSRNGWVYIGYSHTNTNKLDKGAPAMTKVIRGRIKDHQWIDEQTLFEVPDSLMVVNGDRWGCRFLFDKKGYLILLLVIWAKPWIPKM
jgi:glucose/arabinose dehydrogenase